MTPSVSVIVANHNGLAHLPACLESLLRLSYPKDSLELMVVDNASDDQSAEYVASEWPSVRLVASDVNVGLAAGNNLGADRATGDLLVFLESDMRVDPQFVSALVDPFGERDVAAVGARILDWEGRTIDYAGGTCNFAGHAVQVGHGEPADGRALDRGATLFARAGAMAVRREVFLEAGGFDGDYLFAFEDVDLGWRLWLLGYRVIYEPRAIAYHRCHDSAGRVPDHRRLVLHERNALATMLKNYDDDNLARTLPAALLTLGAGVVESAGVDLREFEIKSGSPIAARTVSVPRAAASGLAAAQKLVLDLPALLEKRRALQARRRRPDAEILPLLRPFFPPQPSAQRATAQSAAEGLGVPDLFVSVPRRVLVFSPDLLPYPGFPTVGSGLRAWGIGHGLAAHGHEVVFSMPRVALDALDREAPPEVEELAWRPFGMHEVVERTQPDVVVVCCWPLMASLTQDPFLEVPVVLDQHGPHMLERHYQGVGELEDNSTEKRRALRAADFFSCAGEHQLEYFQDWLEQAGWSDEERRERSAAMLFSLAPELPERQPADELTFVYGGVWLPWQDPSAGLLALVEQLNRRDRGVLRLFGGKHPWIKIDSGVFERLVAELDTSPHVVQEGQVDHAELIRRYTKAHVAIDLMKRNPERELAFTSRTVEFLWCGLPVLYNDYSELSDLIREYDAGWTVDPERPDQIAAALDEIFEQPESVARKSENAQRLVRERLTWDRSTEWLDNVVRTASPRPHRVGFSRVAGRTLGGTFLTRVRRLYQMEGPAAVATKGARVVLGTDARYGWRAISRRIRRGIRAKRAS